MIRSRWILLLTLLPLGACASPPAARKADSAMMLDDAAAAEEDAERRAATKTSAGAKDVALNAHEVEYEVWRSEDFRRCFAESLIAENDIEPKLTLVEREQMQEVLELISSEKTTEALTMLEANRGELASASFDFMVGSLHFQQERLKPAVAALQLAVEKHPKFRRAWQTLAWAHFRNGDYAEALPALTKVIELGGVNALNYGMLGFAHANLKHQLAAESAYRQAVLLDPVVLDWKLGLVESLFKQQRFTDAVALCSTLIAEQPESAKLWMIQANAYIGMGQAAQAAQNLEFVDSMGQATPETLQLLGDIYINEQLYELAGQSYLRAFEKDPTVSPTRTLRAAKDLSMRGAGAETRLLIKRVEELHPGPFEPDDAKNILRLKSRMAAADGATDEEVKILEEIVALDPLDGDALITLGQHANKRGDSEQAILYFEHAASLEAFEADAKVHHAELLIGQRKYAEALPLLRRAQALKPREAIQQRLEQVERVSQSR